MFIIVSETKKRGGKCLIPGTNKVKDTNEKKKRVNSWIQIFLIIFNNHYPERWDPHAKYYQVFSSMSTKHSSQIILVSQKSIPTSEAKLLNYTTKTNSRRLREGSKRVKSFYSSCSQKSQGTWKAKAESDLLHYEPSHLRVNTELQVVESERGLSVPALRYTSSLCQP